MNSYHSDTQRWQAVCARDKNADDSFVYAVLSTGVVCYPSCPSRAARPENVRFYENVTQAVADGYRHCKRCRTDQPPLAVRNRHLVVEACRLMSDTVEPVRIEAVAATLGVSRFHLQKLFKQYTGLSPKAYAQAIRASRLQEQLDSAHSITRSLMEAGYNSVGSFYTDVQKRLGMTASKLRDGSNDICIRYTYTDTPLGLIVVAMTQRGVCAVLFGETRQSLLLELQQRFPQAKLVREDQAIREQVDAVVKQISLPAASLDIPLDIQGTVFQEKVWRALRAIPPGHTASYSQVAQAIGQPSAARAVASACAANPVAVLVPCHRVLRSDGGLSGYRWGVERKQALLDNERD